MGFLHLLHYLQFEITLFAFRNSTMSSQPQGKTAYIPLGLSATNPQCCFLQVSKVWNIVTPQECACLIPVLSYLFPCDRGLLPSLLMIRTHPWLRGMWVGWRNFCLPSAFCPMRRIKHVCSTWQKAGGFLPSLYFLCFPLTVSSLLYFSVSICFTLVHQEFEQLPIFVSSLPVLCLSLSSFHIVHVLTCSCQPS